MVTFAHYPSDDARARALGYTDAYALRRAELISQRVADGSLRGALALDVAKRYAVRLAWSDEHPDADEFTGAECDVDALARAARAAAVADQRRPVHGTGRARGDRDE